MHELTQMLQDMGVIFLLASAVILICHRLHISEIIGFLLTGILAGPYCLGLIDDTHTVELLAEIGVVLLLFTIGIEFSLGQLAQIRRSMLIGGSFQVVATVLAGTLIAFLTGLDPRAALFCGFLLSLSSTAIVLKLLQSRAEMDAPHGRVTLAVLIFQDLAAIPMMLLVPVLAGAKLSSTASMGWAALKIFGVMGFLVIAARWLIPYLLEKVVRTRIRELFLISIAGICLGVAWLSANVGLSLALGAFIAGLIISESEYSHQAMGYILPFRDVFTSLFFVSTGMLLSLPAAVAQLGTVLLLLPLALLVKGLLAMAASLVLGYNLRVSLLVGILLCQIGEFALVVGKLGFEHKLLDSGQYQVFLTLSVLSMILTPFAARLAPWLASRMPGTGRPAAAPILDEVPQLLIIGYGVGGRNLAHAAETAGIPYQILEMNLDTVRKERTQGLSIYYGDATQLETLQHIGILQAQMLVVMISDATATRRVVEVARRMNPKLWILARTRFVSEIDELYNLRADEVVAEEFESSLELFSRVLQRSLIPRQEIAGLISEVRNEHYGQLRSGIGVSQYMSRRLDQQLPDFQMATLRLLPSAPFCGQTLAEAALRNRFDVTVLAIGRSGEVIPHPSPDLVLNAGDSLMLLGKPEAIAQVADAFEEDS